MISHDAFSAMDESPAPPTSRLGECADDYTRREPTKAVISAFGAGVLLNMLPIGAIVAALVGIAFTLIRPALLFFGLIKVCELCGVKAPVSPQHH